MKLHERHFVVERAKLALMGAILDVRRQHDLTTAEWISVLAQALSEQITSLTRYAIRMERHGDDETPGDQAADDGPKPKEKPPCGSTFFGGRCANPREPEHPCPGLPNAEDWRLCSCCAACIKKCAAESNR